MFSSHLLSFFWIFFWVTLVDCAGFSLANEETAKKKGAISTLFLGPFPRPLSRKHGCEINKVGQFAVVIS